MIELTVGEAPLWTVYLGPLVVITTVILCNFLTLKRLNFYTAILQQQAINTATERKDLALVVAAKLATEREQAAQLVHKKLDEAAKIVKDTTLLVAEALSDERKAIAVSVNEKLEKAADEVKAALSKATETATAEVMMLRDEMLRQHNEHARQLHAGVHNTAIPAKKK